MTPAEFAKKVREKYPGSYDDLDDVTLSKKVIEKYPIYAEQVAFGEEIPTKKKAGFIERTRENVDRFIASIPEIVAKRGGELGERFTQFGKEKGALPGALAAGRLPLEIAGRGAAATSDIFFEGLKAVGKQIGIIMPDVIEQPVADATKTLLTEAIKKTPALKIVLVAAQKGL